MAILKLYNFGAKGVNVDKSNLHMEDGELRQAQNVVHNPLRAKGGIVNRPGMSRFNSLTAAGSVLGGIGVPIPDERGDRHLYLGWQGEIPSGATGTFTISGISGGGSPTTTGDFSNAEGWAIFSAGTQGDGTWEDSYSMPNSITLAGDITGTFTFNQLPDGFTITALTTSLGGATAVDSIPIDTTTLDVIIPEWSFTADETDATDPGGSPELLALNLVNGTFASGITVILNSMGGTFNIQVTADTGVNPFFFDYYFYMGTSPFGGGSGSITGTWTT